MVKSQKNFVLKLIHYSAKINFDTLYITYMILTIKITKILIVKLLVKDVCEDM